MRQMLRIAMLCFSLLVNGCSQAQPDDNWLLGQWTYHLSAADQGFDYQDECSRSIIQFGNNYVYDTQPILDAEPHETLRTVMAYNVVGNRIEVSLAGVGANQHQKQTDQVVVFERQSGHLVKVLTPNEFGESLVRCTSTQFPYSVDNAPELGRHHNSPIRVVVPIDK